MKPYHQDPWLTVWQGDCREVMAQMEPESVHCVVTSPPYWGLRDYGTATWLGGDEGCDHQMAVSFKSSTLGASSGGRSVETHQRNIEAQATPYRHTCRKCGAIHQDSQLGLEPTPEEYVANMVAVFREVRRVLRADGTCWVNLGDSYASGGTMGRNDQGRRVSDGAMLEGWKSTPNMGQRARVETLKPKDLVGIPWRVAFALQADGWYLRSDIIWSKPNPMPESVTDRPTKAHEYVFLLSKSARYYYDADAVREPHLGTSWSTEADLSGRSLKAQGAGRDIEARRSAGLRADRIGVQTQNPAGRNLRSVWSIATQPYPGAHFATFPEALVEPCIKAGTSERGVCPECGAPWRRLVDATKYEPPVVAVGARNVDASRGDKVRKLSGADYNEQVRRRTTGWQPSCAHDTIPVPATVLDPFAGSGTTGRVAQRLGRRAVLIDLNGEYLTQAMKRNADIPLGLETA